MRLSAPLATIAHQLETSATLTPDVLAATLHRKVTIDDVAPFVHFNPANYVRSLITRTARWELRLLCWRPGQSSAMHGHGGAACAFRILRGSARETILGRRDQIVGPGAVIEESPATIHQVANAGEDALLTLHAYSPPLPVDAPSPRQGRNIVIVGGGFAGAATAWHLLRRAPADLRITIVERGPWLGRGVAYGVDGGFFRLNVPASRMSLDPDQPDDFVSWAGSADQPHAFLTRSAFGEYVVDRLGGAIVGSMGKLRVVRGEAVRADHNRVWLSAGDSLEADAVVLATGITPRIAPQWLATDARIVDGWDECGLAALPKSGRILVLGAGLSALDVIGLLEARDFRGSYVVLSRSGLLPRPHLEPFRPALPRLIDIERRSPRRLKPLLAWVRAMVRAFEQAGHPWQDAIDAIRPHVASIWRDLPPSDRARFVRSVRAYWDVLRHRAPADALRLVERLQTLGRLERVAGRVLACQASGERLEVDLRRVGGSCRREPFDAIVRCIGPALEHAEADTPLVRSLLDQGIATRDPAGLGIVTDELGALPGLDGRPSDRFFALGALRRASSWESTSVPDIAVHAQALARRLLGDDNAAMFQSVHQSDRVRSNSASDSPVTNC
jgi:uncharacterized NAD(P)/FAD-binding protein YdhS/quercetin dioxygenase-like cupin family protein